MKKTFLAVLLLVWILVPQPIQAAETPAIQSSLAQEFEMGQNAIAQGAWDSAITHFDAARRLAPLIPENYFNLGTAHRKKGAPILAALWFQAYLETLPDAADRNALRAEIQRLLNLADQQAQNLIQLAQASVSKFPDELSGEKESALRALAAVQAATGRTAEAMRIYPIEDASLYEIQYGEYSAAAHDYGTVKTLIQARRGSPAAYELQIILAHHQIARMELDLAFNTLTSMPPSEKRDSLITKLATLLTRELKTKEAELLLAAAGKDTAHDLRLVLLLGYIKALQTDQAVKLAEEIQKSSAAGTLQSVARIVLGQGDQVLEELKKQVSAEPQQKTAEELYAVATSAAWLGQAAWAEQSALELEKMSSSPAGKNFAAYALMARAYTESEKQQFDKALEKIKNLDPISEAEFAASWFWRLAAQKRFDEMARLIENIRIPSAAASLRQKLAGVYIAGNQPEKAMELINHSFQEALSSNTAYVMRNLGILTAHTGHPEVAATTFQTERVLHWVSLAQHYQNHETIADLSSYMEHNKSEDLRILTSALSQAAGDWAQAVTLIRGIEKRHDDDSRS